MTQGPRCRFCTAVLHHTFADLGETPLANAYLSETDLERPEHAYPLHARVCGECFLVQIDGVVSPEELFGEYAYYSSFSTSWLEHSNRFAAEASRRFALDADALVIEVASNDGYLLRYFQDAGVRVLGIEPARNIARDANVAGVPTEAEFFGVALAMDLMARGKRPDLLIGNNVLAHVPNLNDFVAGLATLLKPTSVLAMEFPHLLNLIAEVQFDTIYHEHFSYFSLLAAEQVLDAHGLFVFDVERLPTHGGSLRIYAARSDGPDRKISANVLDLRHVEEDAGFTDVGTYVQFADRVEVAKKALRSFLEQARVEGKSVAAYGAAAKGNTLLNTIGTTTDLVSYVVDRSPHKQGLFMPGSHIPIYSPDRVFETQPDYVLILPWNLADEILEQMVGVRSWGGKFVVPIPDTRILP